MPASVTIPQGRNGVTFTITMQLVPTSMNVTIFASCGLTIGRTLDLLGSGGLDSLSLDPRTVIGGETSQGMVTLQNFSKRLALQCHLDGSGEISDSTRLARE